MPSAQIRRVASSGSEAFPHHLVAHHVRDTDSGGARAVNDHPLVSDVDVELAG
jgi:hypothetical protein